MYGINSVVISINENGYCFGNAQEGIIINQKN